MGRILVKLTALMVLLVFVSSLFAADASNCQYATFETRTKTVQNTYVDGEKVTETVVVNVLPLESVQKRAGIDSWATNIESFQVSNMMKVAIDVHISYFYEGQQKNKDVSLPPLGSTRVTETPYDTIYGPPIKSNYKLSNNFDVSFTSREGSVEKRQEQETYQEKICKQCPIGSGVICANDGEKTDIDVRCGSGFRNINQKCVSKTQGNTFNDVVEFLQNNICWVIGIFVLVLFVIFGSRGGGRSYYGGGSGLGSSNPITKPKSNLPRIDEDGDLI